MKKVDILIIGCGAVGVAVAREFAHYQLNIVVVDKNSDVGGDATPACSSIIGTGYANPPGSLVAKLSHASNMMFPGLLRDLEISHNPCGCIMPAYDEEQLQALLKRLENARNNCDYDVEFVTGKEAESMEPMLAKGVMGAIYSPRETVVDTFELVYAQAENCAANGVEFILNCKVTGVDVQDKKIQCIHTTKGDISAKWVVNAAGLHSDEISKMIEGDIEFSVHPRKGQFFVLDKNTACKVSHIIMPVPTAHTRGKLMLPTAHGNMLVGPTAEDITDKQDTKVTAEGLKEVERDIRKLVPGVNLNDAITEFAGLRPTKEPEGYRIGFSEKINGYMEITGIRSDGIGTSLGIGKYVRMLFEDQGIQFERKTEYIRKRRAIRRFAEASWEERENLVKQDPLYGRVICRCETVTEAEIVQAIHRIPGATTLDGIKRRLRAGMGRCQGGFCSPKVIEILARELGKDTTEITKNNSGSYLLSAHSRKIQSENEEGGNKR